MSTSPTHDYSDLEPSVSDRLRMARERRTGLDQADFAELIGVSRGTVSHYERDRLPGGPRQRLVLNAWAQATGTTREWLETGVAADAPPPSGQPVPKVDEAGLEALRAAKRSRRGRTAEYLPAA